MHFQTSEIYSSPGVNLLLLRKNFVKFCMIRHTLEALLLSAKAIRTDTTSNSSPSKL
jgi:hypothetical protein